MACRCEGTSPASTRLPCEVAEREASVRQIYCRRKFGSGAERQEPEIWNPQLVIENANTTNRRSFEHERHGDLSEYGAASAVKLSHSIEKLASARTPD